MNAKKCVQSEVHTILFRDYDSQRTEALLAFAYREVCLFKQALNEAIR